MSNNVLPATNDFVFKLLFGDKRNKSMLIDMLKAFVDLPDEEYELTFLDTHLKPEFKEDKLGILDVKVQTKTGKIINIEIQVEPQRFIAQRLSFYKSKMIVEQIGESEKYERIHRVICVCITSQPLFRNVKNYLNRFRFCNMENGLCFEDIPEEIYTLELSKVPIASDGTNGWEWVQFLLARTKEEIEMLTKGNQEIQKAAKALYKLSANPKVRAQYEMREKAWRDRASQIAAAEDKVRDEWQGVVASKDAENEQLRAESADKDTKIADRDAKIADRDVEIADKDAENEQLRAENERLQAQLVKFQEKSED